MSSPRFYVGESMSSLQGSRTPLSLNAYNEEMFDFYEPARLNAEVSMRLPGMRLPVQEGVKCRC